MAFEIIGVDHLLGGLGPVPTPAENDRALWTMHRDAVQTRRDRLALQRNVLSAQAVLIAEQLDEINADIARADGEILAAVDTLERLEAGD